MARRTAVCIAVLALGWAGFHAQGLLDRRLEPELPSMYGTVEARLPGVSAAELERVLTVPVERELLRLPAVFDSWAETRDGLMLITLECEPASVASGAAWPSIEDRLSRLREDLADGFIGLSGPVLHRPSTQWAAALISLAHADEAAGAAAGGAAGEPAGGDAGAAPPVELAHSLADQLTATGSVAHVELVGRPLDQIVLTYEDDELARAGLTPVTFREYLRAQHLLAPGAYLRADGRIRPIETVSRIRDFETLTQLPVRDPADGDPVSLSRLLDVSREPILPTVLRLAAGGRPAMALAVYRSPRADLDSFAADVSEAIASFSERHAVACDLVVFQPEVVDAELGRFWANLFQGFVAILLLLMLVLGPRVGLSVALVIPFAVLASFVVMHAAGLGLDVVSLSSLILVLGLMVDNHIVMAERIRRLGEQGVGLVDAMRQAGRELRGPLLAAAATTVLGFLPIVLTNDPIGDYVGSLFWVVLITLSVSLLFCFLVTPLLQPRNLPARTEASLALERRYTTALAWCLARRVPLIVLVVLLCGGGFALLRSQDQIFFPASSRPLWLLEVERPQGLGVEETEVVTGDLDRLLLDEQTRDDTALRHWVSFVGRSAPPLQASIPYREFAPHYAQVLLQLDPAADPDALEQRLRAWMAEHEDQARLRLRPVRLGTQFEWPIQLQLRGPEDALHAAAATVAERLVAAGCVNVSTDWSLPISKLSVEPDRAALADRDLTVVDVTLGMHSVVHGLPLFDLLEGDRHTPVMLRAAVRRQDPREALADAYVYPEKGDPALLYEVAEVRETLDYPTRVRRRGVPAVTVRGEMADPGRTLAVEAGLHADLDDVRAAHPRLTIGAQGVSASSARANQAMSAQIPWALLAILLCLLAQSRSLIDTGLILLTIPLSFAGVAFGLALLGEPFSFMTLVGMTALAGIVVNNAIVLLASIRRRVEEAGAFSAALLIDSAAHRLRPILLTSLCALASMGVLAFSGGPMWRPLATAVISGLIASTALVLFVLPVLYDMALRRVPGGSAKAS